VEEKLIKTVFKKNFIVRACEKKNSGLQHLHGNREQALVGYQNHKRFVLQGWNRWIRA